MRKWLLLLIVYFLSSSVYSKVWNCSRAFPGAMGNDYAIPPVNITLNANMPDNTLLYTLKRVTPGVQKLGNCESSSIIWHITLQNAGTPVYTGAINGINVAIYPTNIPGLGISINDADNPSATYGKPVK